MSSELNMGMSIMDLINVKRLKDRVLKNWYWFGLFFVMAIVFTKITLRYEDNVYQVHGSMLIQEDQTEQLSTQNLEGVGTGVTNKNYIGDQIKLLNSRRLMETVIKDLGLYKRYFTIGKVKTNEAYKYYPIIFREINEPYLFFNNEFVFNAVDKEKIKVTINQSDTILASFGDTLQYRDLTFAIDYNFPLQEELALRIENPKYLASQYAKKLKVNLLKNTHILALELTDNLPQRSIDIMYRLVRNYNEYVLEFKNDATFKTLDFIDERLKFITKELYDVESDVEEFKKRNNLALKTDESAKHVINKLYKSDEDLSSLELKEQLLIDLQKSIQESVNTYDYLPSSLGDKGGSISQSIGEYNKLVNERNRLLIAAKEKNPVVQSTNKQLDLLKETMLRSIEMTLSDISSRTSFLETKINPVEKQVKDIPKYERRLIQIMRQQKVKEALFTFLLQKREEYSMTLASEVNYTRMIDDPEIGLRVSPRAKRSYMLNAILALCVPAFFLVIAEFFDHRIYDLDDIARHTNAPVLGSIVEDNRKDREGLVIKKQTDYSSYAEAFRYLRSHLIKYITDSDLHPTEVVGKVVLVTSGSENEGKTYISSNLASSLAIAGHRSVTIDCDFRKEVNKNENPGLANFLIGDTDLLEDIIKPHDEISSLHQISSGISKANPADYFISERMNDLFKGLRERFDYIILDTSALSHASDAFGLRSFADLSIVILRYGLTTKSDLDVIDEVYQNEKLPRLSLVFNSDPGKKNTFVSGFDHKRKRIFKFFNRNS